MAHASVTSPSFADQFRIADQFRAGARWLGAGRSMFPGAYPAARGTREIAPRGVSPLSCRCNGCSCNIFAKRSVTPVDATLRFGARHRVWALRALAAS